MSELSERFETHDPGAKQVAEKNRCDACPVTSYIAEGRTGACDRYGNVGGRVVRMDPLTVLEHSAEAGAEVVIPGRLAADAADRATAAWPFRASPRLQPLVPNRPARPVKADR